MSDDGIRITPHDQADQATAATTEQIVNYLNNAQRDFVRRHGILADAAVRAAVTGVTDWLEVDYDATPIEVRRIDPVRWSADNFPERWQESSEVRFPSDEKAARMVYARTDTQRLGLMTEAAQRLTEEVKTLEVERDTLAQRIEALEAQVAALRGNDNSPALGGQKETT